MHQKKRQEEQYSLQQMRWERKMNERKEITNANERFSFPKLLSDSNNHPNPFFDKYDCVWTRQERRERREREVECQSIFRKEELQRIEELCEHNYGCECESESVWKMRVRSTEGRESLKESKSAIFQATRWDKDFVKKNYFLRNIFLHYFKNEKHFKLINFQEFLKFLFHEIFCV